MHSDQQVRLAHFAISLSRFSISIFCARHDFRDSLQEYNIVSCSSRARENFLAQTRVGLSRPKIDAVSLHQHLSMQPPRPLPTPEKDDEDRQGNSLTQAPPSPIFHDSTLIRAHARALVNHSRITRESLENHSRITPPILTPADAKGLGELTEASPMRRVGIEPTT